MSQVHVKQDQNLPRDQHVFVRLDKIGDLIVSLPCDEIPAAQAFHPNTLWLVDQKNVVFLDCSIPRRKGQGLDLRLSTWKKINLCIELFRRAKSVIILQAPWWLSFAAWWARVPVRVGRKSQWHSFLFLNCGLRQKRHLSERHESEYGAELVTLGAHRLLALQQKQKSLNSQSQSREEFPKLSKDVSVTPESKSFPSAPTVKSSSTGRETALISQKTQEPSKSRNLLQPGNHSAVVSPPTLQMTVPHRSRGRGRGGHLFEKWGLQKGSYIVVHPGMQGSALNWSANYYAQFLKDFLGRLSVKNVAPVQVLLTGLTGECEELILTLKQTLDLETFSNRVVDASGQLSIKEWMQLLDGSACVVGPSSGVVHVAASLGVPVVGLYSPVLAQSSVRWGPRGIAVRVLTPSLADSETCPGKRKCLGKVCPHFFCMERISPQAVSLQVLQLSGFQKNLQKTSP